MNTHLDSYESLVSAKRLELPQWFATNVATVSERTLHQFLINYCSLGVAMTEPVPDWIQGAGKRCIELGYHQLGEALVAHASHEAGHHELMRNDTRSLVKLWNAKHGDTLNAEEFLDQPLTAAVRAYQKLHEKCREGNGPYAQIAIEYEIERVSVEVGPVFVQHCVNVFGKEFLENISFITDHVSFDVGHTMYNKRVLGEFLEAHPEALNVLADAGKQALTIYRDYTRECLELAMSEEVPAPSANVEHACKTDGESSL